MRWFATLLSLLCLAIPLAACVAGVPGAAQASRTAHIRADGTVTAGVRSALDGIPSEAGPQEILGIYLPFPGTGLAIKGGVLWDGTPRVIEVPLAAPAAVQAAPQTVEVDEVYTVPVTRYEQRTRKVRKVVLPVPAAAPDPCVRPEPPVSGVPRAAGDDMGACPSGVCSPVAAAR